MLNKALLANRDELNEFTHELAVQCQRKGSVTVTARNGTQFEVCFGPAGEDGNDNPLFYTSDWHYCWEADGSSVTNRDLDIIEFLTV